jgi:hypothetical protein
LTNEKLVGAASIGKRAKFENDKFSEYHTTHSFVSKASTTELSHKRFKGDNETRVSIIVGNESNNEEV